MRNAELDKLDALVGDWQTTISDAWFLEPPGVELPGTATIAWLGESFLHIRLRVENGPAHSETNLIIGRSDPNNAYTALYHDDRGVCRQFATTFADGHWTMTREDPDFHQRFIADLEPTRILARWEASDDHGKTWRKDYDLTFVRA